MADLISEFDPGSYSQKRPLVSVQMPVYNGAEYLAEAIDSVLCQTLENFEFIIIDDGSTDNSLAILQVYAGRDARIRLFTRENRGLSATQHELVTLARGEFIAQLDQDDIALPQRLDLQVDFLNKNSAVVCVGGSYQLIDGAGRYLTTLRLPTDNLEIQAANLQGHCALLHPAAMMRRGAVLSVGSYDTSYNTATDIDLWLRLGEIGQLANLDSVILKYRLHVKSASENAGKSQREEAKRACESAWRRRGVIGVFNAGFAWRPENDDASKMLFALQYGWWAWNSCQRSTAIYYGWKAVKLQLFSVAGWKLLLVALMKPLPRSGEELG
jgi:glycosyltransferase involved in cell wall biosynthesis